MGGSWCVPSGPKLVYRNSDSILNLMFRMRFEGVYRMSEKGVLPKCFFLSGGYRARSGAFLDPILGIEVALCSIGVFRGVFQVVQNWFTGISNPMGDSMLE